MGELTTVQTQPQTKRQGVPSRALATSLVLSALALANAAHAEIDVTPVTSELSGLTTPIGLVGAAFLVVLVTIKGWKIIRRAL